MTCDDIRPRLTGYLDGDLDPDRGSAVRGHLRECAACRQVASDEAALRDGLRQLPPLDPPPSLWAGVQAQLAAAEVADAKRPAWKRALVRWAPRAPQFALGGLVAAAAITVLWWRTSRGPDAPESNDLRETPPGMSEPVATAPVFKASRSAEPATMPAGDVTTDLQGEAAQVTASHGDTAEDLLALANEAREQWSTEQKEAFDVRLAELRGEVDRSAEGRVKQKAWRELILFVQRAAVRDEIALAGGGQ